MKKEVIENCQTWSKNSEIYETDWKSFKQCWKLPKVVETDQTWSKIGRKVVKLVENDQNWKLIQNSGPIWSKVGWKR
jgi:hypothetical protein